MFSNRERERGFILSLLPPIPGGLCGSWVLLGFIPPLLFLYQTETLKMNRAEKSRLQLESGSSVTSVEEKGSNLRGTALCHLRLSDP